MPPKAENPYVLSAEDPALYGVELAVKAYMGLKSALYTVFRSSICVQNRGDEMDI